MKSKKKFENSSQECVCSIENEQRVLKMIQSHYMLLLNRSQGNLDLERPLKIKDMSENKTVEWVKFWMVVLLMNLQGELAGEQSQVKSSSTT